MKTVGNGQKTSKLFLLLHLKYENGNSDTKVNASLRNINNSESEPIRANLYRTRSIYENLIRNTDS